MLQLHQDTVNQIIRWASQHPLIEVTGIVGRDNQGYETLTPMRNIAKDPARYYAWDPAEMRQAYERMDTAGQEAVAFYHSHPNGREDPSERDMEGALNVDMHYLIAYPAEIRVEAPQLVAMPEEARPTYGYEWQVSAWECISEGILLEAELVVVP